MGKSRSLWLCFPVLRLTSSFWRCPLSRRSLIIATLCAVYLLFVVSYVGYSQQHRDRRTDKHKYRHTRGLETDGAFLDSADLPTGESFVVPTRSNVVYITLKFKRLKPANIRGTIRPKLRRKLRKTKSASSAFTQDKLGALERDAGQSNRHFAPKTSWRETRDVDYKSLDGIHSSHRDEVAESNTSSIRIYSQRAPQWFSAQDVGAMRFLADAKVLRIREVSRGESPSPLLVFEGETRTRGNHSTARGSVCKGRCGVITSPVDTTEVFAFHLDRVLGLNRTLPAVGRKFRFLHGRSPGWSVIQNGCKVWPLSKTKLIHCTEWKLLSMAVRRRGGRGRFCMMDDIWHFLTSPVSSALLFMCSGSELQIAPSTS